MKFHLSIVANWLLFIAVIFFLIIIQTTVINTLLPSYLTPDFISVLVIYVGIKRGLGEGILFTIIMSYLYAINSSVGFVAASFFQMAIFFMARYVGSNFYISTARDFILAIMGTVFIQKIFILFWLRLGSWVLFMSFIPQVIARTVITAVIGLFVFRLLYRVDILTHRLELESLEDNRGLI